MQAIDLEDELGCEGVEALDRREDGLLALAQEATNRARVDLDFRAIGGDTNGNFRSIAVASSRLGAKLDAARVVGEEYGLGADEDIDTAAWLLVDVDVNQL